MSVQLILLEDVADLGKIGDEVHVANGYARNYLLPRKLAVEANKDYVFFYEKFDKNADEYVLTCERSMEQNALYVIFSPNTFTKANDNRSDNNWRDQPMPRQLSYADLLKWLARNQAKDEAMVVRTSVISIRR